MIRVLILINFFYLHTVIKNNLAKLGVIVSIKVNNKNPKIEEFCKQLSMHIAALNPLALKPEDIDINLMNKEKELINEELKESGKPENIVAITAASYESFNAYAAELEATSLKLTCDILVSISSTMNLKAFALSTTRVVSWSVSLVAVVSLPLV